MTLQACVALTGQGVSSMHTPSATGAGFPFRSETLEMEQAVLL